MAESSGGANPRMVPLPRSRPALELYDVYETIPKLFIIASDANKTVFNILKIDRLSTEELSITEDATPYSHVQIKMVVDTLRSAFTEKDHYFNFLTSGYGLMGFIRFTKGYNLVMITKRSKVAQLGPHCIYEVKGTEVRPLSNERKSFTDEETRYHNLFTSFETKKDFYFSYSYDLSHSLQFNCQRLAKSDAKQERPLSPGSYEDPLTPEERGVDAQHTNVARYDDMFVYNSFLLHEYQKELGDCNSKWVLPCIHGSLTQKTLDCNGRKMRLILIGRRSRYFAGTRFLKRGISEDGNVANHIETEQILYDASSLANCGTVGLYSSYVQVRGSVPLYWYQPRLVEPTKLRPPIKLGRGDTWNSATKLHFAQLFASYGAPLICLDLLKQKEKIPREAQLGREYSSVIEGMNDRLPLEDKIRYIGWDFRKASREQEKVNNEMASIAEETFAVTGMLTLRPLYLSHLTVHITHTPPFCIRLKCVFAFQSKTTISLQKIPIPPTGMFTTGGNGGSTTEQTGVVRMNCVDCLDRTNLAQFFIGKHALFKQLEYLGVLSDEETIVHTLLEVYLKMGDQIAMQYGGSKAVTLGLFNRGGWGDIATSVVRYCNNRFWDNRKQESLNIFLGNYTTFVGDPTTTSDDSNEDDPYAHPPGLDAKALGQYYAFQRPLKFLLKEDTEKGPAINPTIPAPNVNTAQTPSYSFPGHTRSEQRLPNVSFGGALIESNREKKDECVTPQKVAAPLPNVQSAHGERRVIDLWDIENDHYLHVQGASTGRSFAPPPLSLPSRWWEAPLAMFNSRLITTKHPARLGSFSGNSLFRCYMHLHESDFAGSVCARYATRSPSRQPLGGRFGVPQSFRSQRGHSAGFSLDASMHSRVAPPMLQQSPDNLLNSLKTISELDRTERSLHPPPLQSGDDVLAEFYPTSHAKTITFFPDMAQNAEAVEDTLVLADPIDVHDANTLYLRRLKDSIEGKFSTDAPYLWPVNTKPEADVPESWRILSPTLDAPRTEDVPTENYTRYEDYCKLQLYYEQTALCVLNGKWGPYLKEVRQSPYYRTKIEQEYKDAWMVTHTVRDLVSTGAWGEAHPARLLELEREYSERSDFAPSSMKKYQQYARNAAGDFHSGEDSVHEALSPASRNPEDTEKILEKKYEDYVNKPARLQEELCSIEAEALQHGTYSPEQDTGPVVSDVNKVFSPFLENPVPDCKLEATLRNIVHRLRAELELCTRVRSLRAVGRMKGTSSDLTQMQFHKVFISRQAVEYIMNNIPHLHLSPDNILSDKRPRERAVEFLDLLLQAGIFHHVLDGATATPSKFTDGFGMYRFMEDEELRVLNVDRGLPPPSQPQIPECATPIELSKVLITKALYLLRVFEDGSDTEVLVYVQSARYRELSSLLKRLAGVNLSLLATDHDKIAFWTNVYNTLHIDAQFTIGGAFPVQVNVYLSTSCYTVGGYVLSLDDIQHGILRVCKYEESSFKNNGCVGGTF